MIQILLAISGVFALVKGEFNITRNRRVVKPYSQIAGVIMLAGAAAPLLIAEAGLVVMIVALVIAIVIGYAKSEQTV